MAEGSGERQRRRFEEGRLHAQLLEEFDVHRHRVLVELVATAILGKGHTRHEEGAARQLEALHARLALPRVLDLTTRLQPDGQPLRLPLNATRAVVEARVPRHEEARLARRACRTQPREVGTDRLLALTRLQHTRGVVIASGEHP